MIPKKKRKPLGQRWLYMYSLTRDSTVPTEAVREEVVDLSISNLSNWTRDSSSFYQAHLISPGIEGIQLTN